MRLRVVSIIAFVTLVWAADARAGTLTFDTFFQGYGGQFVVASESAAFVTGSALANTSGLGTLDALSPFEAFCVDFDTSIFADNFLGPYTADVGSMATDWHDGSGLETLGSGQRAAWLYETYAPTLAPIDDFAINDLGRIQRSALQMAIWNALYDNDFSVAANSGNTYFTDLGAHPDILTWAEFYLNGNGTGGGLQGAGASLLTADAAFLQLTYPDGTQAQDFIGPRSVPEPATVLLLGIGMTGLAFRSRKSLRRG